MYIVIGTDGVLTRHDATPTADLVEAAVGPEGWDTVWLRPAGLRAWVNDLGLKLPETYPRNVVGSCMLASLGAGQQPYAGPVVITGWNPLSTGPEIQALTTEQITLLGLLHDDVERALAGHRTVGTEAWAAGIREFAERVRTEAPPPVRVLTGDDAWAALMGEPVSDGA